MPRPLTAASIIAKELSRIGAPAETFARLVAFAINEPEDVGINEILVRPTAQEL